MGEAHLAPLGFVCLLVVVFLGVCLCACFCCSVICLLCVFLSGVPKGSLPFAMKILLIVPLLVQRCSKGIDFTTGLFVPGGENASGKITRSGGYLKRKEKGDPVFLRTSDLQWFGC